LCATLRLLLVVVFVLEVFLVHPRFLAALAKL
jgi:hypothetical protein